MCLAAPKKMSGFRPDGHTLSLVSWGSLHSATKIAFKTATSPKMCSRDHKSCPESSNPLFFLFDQNFCWLVMHGRENSHSRWGNFNRVANMNLWGKIPKYHMILVTATIMSTCFVEMSRVEYPEWGVSRKGIELPSGAGAPRACKGSSDFGGGDVLGEGGGGAASRRGVYRPEKTPLVTTNILINLTNSLRNLFTSRIRYPLSNKALSKIEPCPNPSDTIVLFWEGEKLEGSTDYCS